MRLLGLPLVSLFFLFAAARDDFDFTNCSKDNADVEKCAQPIDSVVAVTPGASYFTTIACKDCPYAETLNEDPKDHVPTSRITHGDQELFLNVTLTNDTRSILLNGKRIFPTLNTIPTPPQISVQLLHPTFSYKNLSAATSCPNPTCDGTEVSPECIEWCQHLPLGRLTLDFEYAAHLQKEEPDANIRYWEIVFDPVGGRSGVSSSFEFDDPDRKSLLIVVAGQPVKPGHKKAQKGSQDGGLFGSVGGDDVYELEIIKVEQVMRRFNFSTPRLTIWGKIKRFFGADVWKADGELVYLSEEWSAWGKKGTLRNLVGNVFHSNFVGLFFIIIGSIVGGFIALRVIHSLYGLIKQQSGLARWEGIDAVYSQLNQERAPEDEESYLYRDSFDEGASRRSLGYNDERTAMKPLPTKPLPEKPLPQEPLIDT